MKKLLFFTFLLFSTLKPFAQPSYIEIADLKGKVKTIKETGYEAIDKFGEISRGKSLRKREYLKDWMRFYNKNEQVVKIIYTKLDGSFSMERKIIYNDKGKLLEVERYGSNNKLDSKSIYTYSENGKILTGKIYSGDGKLEAIKVYKLDDIGNILEQSLINNEDNYSSLFLNSYDEDNNLVNSYDKVSSAAYVSVASREYKYNINKKLEETVNYKLYQEEKLMLYDIRKAVKQDFYKVSTELLYYNDRGYIDKEVFNRYDSSFEEKDITTYEYLYDLKGNWIQRIENINDINKYILVREFEYYD